MTALERRYRRLLWAYPAGYRRERGADMLGTVLENTPPGRRWPTLREAWALVLGGLRVRCWPDPGLAMAANVRLAVLLGLTLTLLRLATAELNSLIISWRGFQSAPPGAGCTVAYLALAVAVTAAAFFAQARIAAGLAVVTAGLWFWSDDSRGQGFLAALVLVMLAILVRDRARLPRVWLWLPGSLLAVKVLLVVPALGSLVILPGVPSSLFLSWVILGSTVLWIAVDPRPAIASAILIACLFAEQVGPMVFGVQSQFPWRSSPYVVGAAIVALAAAWRLHGRVAAHVTARRRWL